MHSCHQLLKNFGFKWRIWCAFRLSTKAIRSSLNIDDGYPLIWMHFSTFVFLLCKVRQQTFQTVTALSIPVYLNASKRKEGRAIVKMAFRKNS